MQKKLKFVRILQFDGFFVTSQNTQNLHFNLTIFLWRKSSKDKKVVKNCDHGHTFSFKNFWVDYLRGRKCSGDKSDEGNTFTFEDFPAVFQGTDGSFTCAQSRCGSSLKCKKYIF